MGRARRFSEPWTGASPAQRTVPDQGTPPTALESARPLSTFASVHPASRRVGRRADRMREGSKVAATPRRCPERPSAEEALAILISVGSRTTPEQLLLEQASQPLAGVLVNPAFSVSWVAPGRGHGGLLSDFEEIPDPVRDDSASGCGRQAGTQHKRRSSRARPRIRRVPRKSRSSRVGQGRAPGSRWRGALEPAEGRLEICAAWPRPCSASHPLGAFPNPAWRRVDAGEGGLRASVHWPTSEGEPWSGELL